MAQLPLVLIYHIPLLTKPSFGGCAIYFPDGIVDFGILDPLCSIARWWFPRFYIFTPSWGDDPGEMIQFDEPISQMGWFNHQLDELFVCLLHLSATLFNFQGFFCWTPLINNLCGLDTNSEHRKTEPILFQRSRDKIWWIHSKSWISHKNPQKKFKTTWPINEIEDIKGKPLEVDRDNHEYGDFLGGSSVIKCFFTGFIDLNCSETSDFWIGFDNASTFGSRIINLPVPSGH